MCDPYLYFYSPIYIYMKEMNNSDVTDGSQLVSTISNKQEKILSEFLRRTLMILSFRAFELLSSSLLLYSQRFDRYVLQPFSGVSCGMKLK